MRLHLLSKNECPDAKGALLIGIAFFALVLLAVAVDFSANVWLDLFIGGGLCGFGMVSVIALVKALGWVRPRRKGEWL